MSESVASITPFVCKWFGCHSKRFSTQVDLEYHVYTDHQDLNKLKTLYRGLPIYNCPWEGCKYRLRDISKFRALWIIQAQSIIRIMKNWKKELLPNPLNMKKIILYVKHLLKIMIVSLMKNS
ncbi:hypothetical protein RirG_079690 [Rhizophagus irregularis DAOM 197198w]|uniref:C2H2-type domain-containing protein n=1 Tax=Rhizophagus irregularis (strain DAOM 197198w) TaxID=1432141 RepID=A0A015JP46_RHIIW|nr:hypothetical protein RirG_079690 [Rhizophagus irregularis DAOM 197198w]